MEAVAACAVRHTRRAERQRDAMDAVLEGSQAVCGNAIASHQGFIIVALGADSRYFGSIDARFPPLRLYDGMFSVAGRADGTVFDSRGEVRSMHAAQVVLQNPRVALSARIRNLVVAHLGLWVGNCYHLMRPVAARTGGADR